MTYSVLRIYFVPWYDCETCWNTPPILCAWRTLNTCSSLLNTEVGKWFCHCWCSPPSSPQRRAGMTSPPLCWQADVTMVISGAVAVLTLCSGRCFTLNLYTILCPWLLWARGDFPTQRAGRCPILIESQWESGSHLCLGMSIPLLHGRKSGTISYHEIILSNSGILELCQRSPVAKVYVMWSPTFV